MTLNLDFFRNAFKLKNPIGIKCLIIFIFGAFLFASQINANQVSIGSSDLPYTASTAYDTISFNASKITTSGSGIYVTANYVTIDLRDDTLEFGTGYTDDVYGIYTSYHRTNLTILGNPTPDSGGLILHGGGTGVSDSSWGCVDIRTLGGLTSNTTIINVDMEIYGWDGHNYYHVDGSPKNLVISGGRLIDHIDGFTNRCYNTGISILAGSGHLGSVTIHDVTIDTWAHGIQGGGYFNIYNCSLLVDVKNDLYEYPSGNTCYSSIGVGGIGLWEPTAGTKIHDNVIIAGSENEGCSGGISISYGTGTAESPIEIYNNKVVLHRGPDDCYGGVTTKGYKQRWENKHIHVYDNEFYLSAHSDSGSHAGAWWTACEGFDIIYTSASYGSEGGWQDSFTVIENNHIEAVALDSNSRGVGIRLSVRNELDDYDFVGAGNVFRHNYFGSNSSGVEFGKDDGGQANSVVLIGDTIATIGIVDDDYHTYELGDWSGPSVDNVVRDIVYLGEAADTNIYWDMYGEGSDLRFERTLELLVLGNNDTAVVNALYSVRDKSDQIVASGTTNLYGVDTAIIKYYHAFMSAEDTNYNDFTIVVEKDGYSDSKTLTINSSSTEEDLFPIFNLDVPGTGTTNHTPSAPTPDSTYSTSDPDYQYLNPTFVVVNGSDPDGDALTYEFQLYNTDKTELITSASGITEGTGTTSWTIPESIPSNTTYFWRARCFDGQANSPWSAWSDYSPPIWEGGYIPSPGSIINNASPTLSIHNGDDPSGDVLTYEFELFDSAGVTLVASALNITEGDYYTSWKVPLGLDDSTTYLWHGRCTDGMEYSQWSDLSDFTIIIGSDRNNPPSVPFHASPLDNGTIITLPIELTVDNSLDNENDDITYDFFLYSDASLNQLEEEQLNVAQTANQTSAAFSITPYDGQRLWWRVRASDGVDTSALTTATSFTYTTLGTGGKDNIPVAAIPENGSVINVRQPILVAQNISVSGDNNYYFQLASESDFYDPIETSEAIPEEAGTQTRWQVTSELETGQTYYWRVRINYNSFSDVSSFTIGSKIIAYPNPVSFLNGNDVTFQLPEEPVDLLIQSVSGETVLVKNGISGEWHWNGYNQSGNMVSVGVYSWFIRNSDQNGKIVVKP